MKILIVSQYFYPDSFRINDIAFGLTERGHQVEVVTGLPDYATGSVPAAYRRGQRRRETVRGVAVNRLWAVARGQGKFRRLLNYVSFAFNSLLYVQFHRKDFDVVYCFQTSPVTMALAAVRCRQKYIKPLLLYCCDVWPESLKAWQVGERSPVFRITKAVSRYLYRRCDRIAVSSKPFFEYLENVHGIPMERMCYIPQHAEDLCADCYGRFEDNGVFDFLFAGNVGQAQNVSCIIRAAAKLPADPPFHVHIVGDGSDLEECRALCRALHLEDCVTFYGHYPLEDMPKFYRQADCFLLTLKGGDFVGMTMPGKLPSYMSAGKPVIASTDGAAREVIEAVNCGWCAAADDPDEFAACMLYAMRHPEELPLKGQHAREYFCRHFTLDDFLDELMRQFGILLEEKETAR